TLAWLLDAPDLLDGHAGPWQGRVATLGPVSPAVRAWLHELDAAPAALHAYLDLQPFTRLGRYAERLMAFHLDHAGMLAAHGLQVRLESGPTIGEFDFLVRSPAGLLHWEFATKLYLLEDSSLGCYADYFVGPGLADTLGMKIRKIMDRQLALARHPAAAACLPSPVAAAQALVKGWLFYHAGQAGTDTPPGIAPGHCRGFWVALHELQPQAGHRYRILSRLEWLPPMRCPHDDVRTFGELRERLVAQFDADGAPMLVAVMEEVDGEWIETDRGFIVPSDWQERAAGSVEGLA
ncbi:DUF1853 family protein, partial [Oxalobacteraceae bacterium OM1]